MKLPALAYDVFRDLEAEKCDLKNQKILVACSGGVDSIVLLDVLWRLKERWNLELVVGHVHHGNSANAGLKDYRDKSADFVRELAKSRGLSFALMEAKDCPLKSEADFRQFRLDSIDRVVADLKIDRVALGHHADDLLETRLLRLVRGTGVTGLRAMSMFTKSKIRPFLKQSRAKLLEYANRLELEWIEDVSNTDQRYLRNWIRNHWLAELNQRLPGGSTSLARSLDLLAEISPVDRRAEELAPPSILRAEYSELSNLEKKNCIAAFGYRFNRRDFSFAKVAEIFKRLERLEVTRQREIEFQVGGLVWKIDSKSINVSIAHLKL